MALRADTAARSRARGRPKGTGIDDRDSVAALRVMLAADHNLKPTTAIKRIGVSDPSVIRRLRDKLIATAEAPAFVGPGPITPPPTQAAPIRPAVKALPIPSSVLAEKKDVAPAAIPPPPKFAAGPASVDPILTASAADEKAREMALLVAYLQAMQQSQPRTVADAAPASPVPPPAPKPEPTKVEPKVWPGSGPSPFPFGMMPPMPGMGFPGMPPMTMPGMTNPMQSFSIPGFPSFLQPFQQKQSAPTVGSTQARQLEALKLAIEATTAIARFQLHLVENSAAYSPMALMLQGQSFIGQMMIAGLTGQLGAIQRQMTGAVPTGGEKK